MPGTIIARVLTFAINQWEITKALSEQLKSKGRVAETRSRPARTRTGLGRTYMDKLQQAKKRIEKLKAVINYHRYLYHVLNQQEISDAALDSLKHELYKLEQQYPEFITSDSPTQRVGGMRLKEFKKRKHEIPMLSIEDIFSEKELCDWEAYLNRFIEAGRDPFSSVHGRERVSSKLFEYFCEPKIDGFAVTLIYKNGIFTCGATRGNGRIGEDVTQNLKTIESIPLKLREYGRAGRDPFSSVHGRERVSSKLPTGEVEVRGEVYMEKKDFEKFNKEKEKKGEKPYSNPRNLAAGSIRQLDPKLAASRSLKFIAYAITTDLGQTKHSEEHQILSALGFRTDSGRKTKNLEEVINYWKEIAKKRDFFSFQIDGIVVQVDDNSIFRKLGVAGKSPRGVRAFKFSPKQATTIIKNIKFQIGRTGAITPVAVLEPIEIGGTTITRATLHNEDEIKKLGVKIGDTVIVERAGDVIPAVVKVLPELRSGREKGFHFPRVCPVCHTPLIRAEKEVIWRCPNKNCFGKRKKSLYHFVSKKAFNIDGLGPKIIDKLIEENLISFASDIFFLKQGDLIPLERFAERSAQNLFRAIQESKKIFLSRFIFALGIRIVGEETAIDLAQHFGSLEQIQKAAIGELEVIPDIGPRVSKSIYDWFRQKENQKLIADLEKAGVKISEKRKAKSEKLKNKIFVLTGSLETMARDKAKQRIRVLQGKISGSVSSKTDIVVVGKNPGIKKMDRAKEIGIKTINEQEFLKIITNQ